MKKAKKVWPVLFFAVLFCIVFSMNASAYIDPGTTAMLTQIVAGVIISLGVVFGILRTKIIMFFKNLKVKFMQKKLEKDNQGK